LRAEGGDSSLVLLPPKKRALYGHMFELIYNCSANRVAAKALVDRILERVQALHATKTVTPKAKKNRNSKRKRSVR
jgi:hypothetical protein